MTHIALENDAMAVHVKLVKVCSILPWSVAANIIQTSH